MRRMLALAIAFTMVLHPSRVAATSPWGSPQYGDPPGWCTHFSDMWVATVVTSDPYVGTNPEQNTFYGFHPNPGYDDWYGYFYGDFRGSPGDASGWVKLLHENYPDHHHWNFATNRWAVHGHAKQYIAYYNWTFGGQCGLGRYGSIFAPPYMADQYGWPVVDIYVDSVAPYAPQPRVVSATASSVSFTWDPVADQGDGSGADFFESGMDHYTSWVTVDGGPAQQLAATAAPRTITQTLAARQTACVHVRAFDRVQNGSAEQVACGMALEPPPMPDWGPSHDYVVVNPSPAGLVGFESWMWLDPAPRALTVYESHHGIEYVITAIPVGAEWDFGDGSAVTFRGRSGFGVAYPARSAVAHEYQADAQAGFAVGARVGYEVTWTAIVGGSSTGPYPMGVVELAAIPLRYPVQQAQPELLQVGAGP